MTAFYVMTLGIKLLMLLTHVGFFWKMWSDTFKSVLVYGKEQESRRKIFHNRAKKFIFLRSFDRRNTFFLEFEKSNSKRLFLNDSKCKSVTRG